MPEDPRAQRSQQILGGAHGWPAAEAELRPNSLVTGQTSFGGTLPQGTPNLKTITYRAAAAQAWFV